MAEGGHLINIEVNIWDVYAFITSMVILVASNSGIRTKKNKNKENENPMKKTEKVNAAY